MKTVKDQAIILRRKPLGEADILLTIYSEKSGKVRVVAKGARKITSKLLGFTELFTVISCQIDFRPQWPIVSQISHEKLFDGIAANRHLYQQLHMLAELVDRGCHEQEADIVLYRCLREGIDRLVVSDNPLILASLVLRISGLLGFDPELASCAHCDQAIEPGQALAWSHQHGGLVRGDEQIKDTRPISIDEVKVLRYLRRASFNDLEKLNVPRSFAGEVESLLLEYVQYVLDQNFASQRAQIER